MRVLLIHNPKAGDRKHGKKQLMASLTRCGHQAFYQSIKERGWKKAFKKPVDLVIAAGGDGTVHQNCVANHGQRDSAGDFASWHGEQSGAQPRFHRIC